MSTNSLHITHFSIIFCKHGTAAIYIVGIDKMFIFLAYSNAMITNSYINKYRHNQRKVCDNQIYTHTYTYILDSTVFHRYKK